MITSRIYGGCGNQMLMYAMGLAQARRLNTELQLDIGKFRRDSMREYNLCLFPRITNKLVENETITVRENGMPYNQAVVDSIKDGDVIDGYWQTEKYFLDIADELRDKFQPMPLDIPHRAWFNKIVTAKNPTFLTVRRTDYVGNTYHGELPESYYWEALRIIAEKTGVPNIFVFSDDPDWCQEHLNLPWPFFVAGTYDRTIKGHLGREDAELYLMSLCKNAVLANSTFSWWGAWLGDSGRKGVVVAPNKWFGTAPEDPRDIIPDRWIKL